MEEPFLGKKLAVQRAALHIQDAWSGMQRIHPREGPVVRQLWLLHLRLHFSVHLAIILLVALSFFEEPPWLSERAPQGYNTTLYPVSGLPMLKPLTVAAVQAPLLLTLAVDALCSATAHGLHSLLHAPRKLAYALILVAAMAESALGAAEVHFTLRLAPFLRLSLLVLHSDALILQMDTVRRTLPQISGVLLVLCFFLLAYAWAAVLLFQGTDSVFTEEGLGETLWQLFICLTTANFPDVMMASYERSRGTIFFFAPFLLLGNLFLLNLILAVVVQAHADSTEHTTRIASDARARSLQSAFELLLAASGGHGGGHGNVGGGHGNVGGDGGSGSGGVGGDGSGGGINILSPRESPPQGGSLPRDTLLSVFQELNHYCAIEHIGQSRAELLFAALDRSGDSQVDLSEFLTLCEMLRIRFEKVPERLWLERVAPRLAGSPAWRRVCQLVTSRQIDYLVDALLVIAGAALVIEERNLIEGRPSDFDSRPDSAWNILELVLSCIFVLEMGLKLAALGWREYTRSLKNVFDALSTVATFAVVVIVYVPNAVSDARLIRFVLLMRLLRLLRLLSWSPHVRFVSSTFVATLPQAGRLLQCLFVLLFFFSALGVELYGGRINLDPQRPEFAKLANTTYAANGYFANNFNDLFSGAVTCFELLLVNNWFVLCEGVVAVTSSWSRVFFIAFYAVGPLIILNIAVAFCIEAFLGFVQQQKASGHVHAATQEIDASQISGTRTGLEGVWRARLVGGGGPTDRQAPGLRALLNGDADLAEEEERGGSRGEHGVPGPYG